MTVTTAHPAAAKAERIRAHLAHDFAVLPEGADGQAVLPDIEAVTTIIEAAFWASLRREEGYSTNLSLAFVAPDQATRGLRFERSLPLAAEPLTKMAPAAERPGIHLCVWREHGELRVWGATRNLPAYCFVLEAIAPGHLVVKQSRSDETGKFVNVAVLQGDEIKVIDPRAATVPDCPSLLTSLLLLESRFGKGAEVNVLIQLAVSMREHQHGGTLLVTPPQSECWRESILHPVTYALMPSFTLLADLLRKNTGEKPSRRWEEEMARTVDEIAGLTAVDGATVMNGSYEVLAFGAKIVRRNDSPQVGRVLVTEPVEESQPMIAEPTELGGTRHLSAAQFVSDQRDSIALVASQDGRFTVFAWSPCEEMVHAHRIDVLLL
jgi:hypothetical protein